MNYVQVITTESDQLVSHSLQSKSSEKAFAFERTLQRIVANQLFELKFSTTYCMQSNAYNYRTMFKVTVDVIEALFNHKTLGVLLIHRLKIIDELSFYLSLFTRSYRKPIVLCPENTKERFKRGDSNVLFLTDQDKSSQDEQTFYKTSSKDLKYALNIASNRTYGMLEPLTISQGNLYLAAYSESENIKMIEQLGNQRNTIKNLMPEPHTLQLSHSVSELIKQIPVIPEKVIVLRLLIDMTGEEIINIAHHYAGVVFEIYDETVIHPSVFQAMEQLIQENIPIIVTYATGKKAKVPKLLQETFDQLGVWTTKQLQSSHARILLGVMLAQKMPRGKMAQVCELYNKI